MKTGIALLALALAGLTFRQVPVWHSDHDLWEATARLAPGDARALVNLAVDRITQNQLPEAEALLNHAMDRAVYEPAFAYAMTSDAVHVNLAVIRIRQGRILEARWFVKGAPSLSLGWQLCQETPGICE